MVCTFISDNIGGGSDIKYFTVNDMMSHSSYEGQKYMEIQIIQK